MSCLASCALQELGTHVPMLTLINVVLEAGPFYKESMHYIKLISKYMDLLRVNTIVNEITRILGNTIFYLTEEKRIYLFDYMYNSSNVYMINLYKI